MNKTLILTSGAVALMFSQCTSKNEAIITKERIPMVICFDVEDYTSPESVGMDDIPKWEAETMTEEGVTGTFFVIGEKARMMEKRGRNDVISAMAAHDIGSHTNYGSIHPTVTEILENAGWQEGTEKMLENERAGLDELERIFGKRPVNLARHGGSYGPQLVAALSQLGAGYVYSPISLPGHNVVWFCNALNFHGEGDFGFFDDAYYQDTLFDPMLNALDSLIPASIENIDVMAFFANHPSKVRSVQFWDFNYYKGANPGPEQWQTPELRPLESMETARKNFRRLVRYLGDRDDIELTTFGELSRRYSHQKDTILMEEIEGIAQRVLDEKRVIRDDHYSPAEIFSALTDALCFYDAKNSLPPQVIIRRPFGPLEMPVREPEVKQIPPEEILHLASDAQEVIRETGHLPAFLLYEGKKIGTGSLLALFSDLYRGLDDPSAPEFYEVIPMEPYPSMHEAQIIREVASCKGWPVHREELDMGHLVEMTKLQLWTLKPAHLMGS